MEGCANQTNETDPVCTIGKLHESKIPPTIQFLAGLTGNGLAIVILIRSAKTHRWKPFYRLVLALAFTDAVVSVLVYPIVLKRYFSDFTYCFSDYECYHVSFMYSFSFLGSALLVTSMSIDRFTAILLPFVYSRDTKGMRTTVMIAGSWILATIICLLPVVGVGKPKLYYPGSWCFINFSSKEIDNMIVTYIYAVLGIILFLSTATANIIVIGTLLRRIIQSRKKIGVKTRLKSDIYIVVFLLGVVLVFSVCWVPLISRMMYNVIIDCPADGKMELLVARLAINNSIADPWIYIVLRKENFELLERVIRHCKRKASYITDRTIVSDSRPSVASSQSTKLSETNANPMSNIGNNGKIETVFSIDCK